MLNILLNLGKDRILSIFQYLVRLGKEKVHKYGIISCMNFFMFGIILIFLLFTWSKQNRILRSQDRMDIEILEMANQIDRINLILEEVKPYYKKMLELNPDKKQCLEMAFNLIQACKDYGKGCWEAESEELLYIGAHETGWKLYNKDGTPVRGAAGEVGPLQLLPSTGLAMGLSRRDLEDWRKAIRGCAKYYDQCFRVARGNRVLARAYYNAGYGRGPSVALSRAGIYIRCVSRWRTRLRLKNS